MSIGTVIGAYMRIADIGIYCRVLSTRLLFKNLVEATTAGVYMGFRVWVYGFSYSE